MNIYSNYNLQNYYIEKKSKSCNISSNPCIKYISYYTRLNSLNIKAAVHKPNKLTDKNGNIFTEIVFCCFFLRKKYDVKKEVLNQH